MIRVLAAQPLRFLKNVRNVISPLVNVVSFADRIRVFAARSVIVLHGIAIVAVSAKKRRINAFVHAAVVIMLSRNVHAASKILLRRNRRSPEGPAEDEIEDDGSGGSAHPHNYKADEVRCKISSLNSDVVHYYTGPEDINQLRRFLISCPIVVDDCTVIYRCSKDGCNASRRKYPYHQNKKEDGTPIPDSGLVVEPCPICSENLADAFTTDGVSTFCMKVKCSCPKNTDYAYIKVKVAIPRIDLDIDSDNNNGLGMPDRSQAEELEEEKKDTVGKLVLLNDFDTDGDGIPDFADGYDNINLEPEANQRGDNVSADFVPVVVSISSGLDPAKTKVRFSYPACDPAIVFKRTVDGVMDFLLPPEGNIRLWTKNGSTARAKESIVKDSSPEITFPRMWISHLRS